jgi:GH25 family lysozyme M1 (1,4-beta-N-acetylmuramidase)
MAIKGMDISYFQGDVNFKAVAADGIKFAILRTGYRRTVDSKFYDYVKGCQQNGIKVMAYHFIYTDGATPAQNAETAFNAIKQAGLNPADIWIASDLEYDTWVRNGEVCTRDKCTRYTKEYLNALERLGCHKLFIYANQDYYSNYYDWSQLNYKVWLADYYGDPNYPCAIQQYSSSGKVSGISGNVDMDLLFDESMLNGKPAPTPDLAIGAKGAAVKDLQTKLIALGYSCGKAGVDGDFGKSTENALKLFQKEHGLKVDGSFGPASKAKLDAVFKAFKNKPAAAPAKKSNDQIAKEVIEGKWGEGESRKARLKAAGYDYNLIQNKVNLMLKPKKLVSPAPPPNSVRVEAAHSFDQKIARTYVTSVNLRLRSGPGEHKTILKTMPAGTKVTCYGYYTNDWYYVKCGEYTGFCYKTYLKKC